MHKDVLPTADWATPICILPGTIFNRFKRQSPLLARLCHFSSDHPSRLSPSSRSTGHCGSVTTLARSPAFAVLLLSIATYYLPQHLHIPTPKSQAREIAGTAQQSTHIPIVQCRLRSIGRVRSRDSAFVHSQTINIQQQGFFFAFDTEPRGPEKKRARRIDPHNPKLLARRVSLLKKKTPSLASPPTTHRIRQKGFGRPGTTAHPTF
ncbi:hypothetical protein BDP55DRAFT_72025 [Colletotrichum godetiae]|uniref:Uncharacterized protein n=1 Tax=Colletotrichum godetiae TaxID=1209918 RepID=A0AAJ0APC5_9PEZI|nr:uncharacterized protein BDP55DRAFT_72025 [Colletotrichum godetiae]KAK1687906.1 hypothetical protein BDP55DRAFT_72025 [Colletotrichum godetiae]